MLYKERDINQKLLDQIFNMMKINWKGNLMLDLANVAISLIKKALHCYFEEKDINYLISHCLNDEIPVIGLNNTTWVNKLSILNEHYQFYRMSETAFVVYGKLTVREMSHSEEHHDAIINVTISCNMIGEEILFTCIHMSYEQGKQFLSETKEVELKGLYREVIEKLYDVFIEYDNVGDTFDYNADKFNELFETDYHFVNVDHMFWAVCTECIHPDDMEKMDVFRNIDIEKRLKTNDYKIEFEVRIKNKAKGYKWIDMVIILLPNSVYKLNKIFYLMKDIDEKKKLELENKIYASKDSLTSVLNRRYSEAMIKSAIRENKDYSALAIIDIDNFKQINDTFGHMSGDDVLKKIVAEINSSIDDMDILGRLGGDEFILFVRNRKSVEDIYKIMDKIMKNTRIVHKENSEQMNIHVSIGAVAFDRTDIEFAELYRVSDEALYEVKGNDKNNYIIKQI